MPNTPGRTRSDPLAVGVFAGPWDSGHTSQDGAVLGFADAERALHAALGADRRFRIVELDLGLFLADDPARALSGVDLVYGNCGPLAALLLHLRQAAGLDFALVREVRTLGWIGYAFQEYVAAGLQRPGDLCLHVSAYSCRVWSGVRPAADRFFYPMLREAAAEAEVGRAGRRGLACGYFSRISADKGFDQLAPIVGRLRDAGWPLARLLACGPVEDMQLLQRCERALRAMGVEFTYHDELDYRSAMRLMRSVDLVLFPSVSSFEAAGRVVLEAYQRGKPVVGSDYCASHDTLRPEFRIPLRFDGAASGGSAHAFPVARLALERWQPPRPDDPCFLAAQCERYRYRPDDVRQLLQPPGMDDGAGPASDVRMEWRFPRAGARLVRDWCEQAWERLRRSCRDRRDLLDLGGAFKRSLIAAGFDPPVSFYPAGSTSERNSSNLPDAARGISS